MVECDSVANSNIALWDESDSRSLINVVKNRIREAILEAYKKRPDLFSMDERTLTRTLKEEGYPPTDTDRQLRCSFWNEYDRAQDDNRMMDSGALYRGICLEQYLYEYLKHARKVAWLVCYPSNREALLDDGHRIGLQRMLEILEVPLFDSKGAFNSKVAELQAKVFLMLDQRKHGAFTQKVENRSLNLNLSATEKSIGKFSELNSMEEIEKRLADLRKRDRKAIEIKPEDT